MSLRSLARSDVPYRFHAFEVSYFSAKVRPALRYKGVWYGERRAELAEIRRRTGFAFIPVVMTPDDETWQGSTDIYDPLERDQIDAAIAGSGWTELLGDPPRHRLCKQNFKLAFEPQRGETPW